MKITKVYTRKGDQGQTSLVGGQRVSKASARLEAYGTVDELNSHRTICSTSVPIWPPTKTSQSSSPQPIFLTVLSRKWNKRLTALPMSCQNVWDSSFLEVHRPLPKHTSAAPSVVVPSVALSPLPKRPLSRPKCSNMSTD